MRCAETMDWNAANKLVSWRTVTLIVVFGGLGGMILPSQYDWGPAHLTSLGLMAASFSLAVFSLAKMTWTLFTK